MLPGAALTTLGAQPVHIVAGQAEALTVCVDDRAAGSWQITTAAAHPAHRNRIARLLTRLAHEPRTPIARFGLAAPGENQYIEGRHPDAACGADVAPVAGDALASVESGFEATSVADLLAEQAGRSPEAVALAGAGVRMSYAELHRAANRLARWLIRKGVGPEQVVGLALGASVEQVVAVHAVVAAGGAYLPLDPEHPRERHAAVLESAGAVCVLTTRREGLDAPAGVRVIHLEDLELGEVSDATVTDADRVAPLRPGNPVYVLFTSGSTGRPKGVGATHAALCSYLAWMQHVHGLGTGDTAVRKTALTFNISAWEVLWPFTAGASVVVDAGADPEGLARAIAENAVTTVQFTPSTLAAH